MELVVVKDLSIVVAGVVALLGMVTGVVEYIRQDDIVERSIRKGQVAAIEGLDDVSIGGFRVHFADDRTGSKLVELSLIDSQGRVRE